MYANSSYILHIGPLFCVLRCDIALQAQAISHPRTQTQVLYFAYRTY